MLDSVEDLITHFLNKETKQSFDVFSAVCQRVIEENREFLWHCSEQILRYVFCLRYIGANLVNNKIKYFLYLHVY